jgi:hypothetical protein
VLVALGQGLQEQCSGLGVVVAGGGGYDELVGVVDHALPHGVGLVVAGVDEDDPVVLGSDLVDGVDVAGADALGGGQVCGL